MCTESLSDTNNAVHVYCGTLPSICDLVCICTLYYWLSCCFAVDNEVVDMIRADCLFVLFLLLAMYMYIIIQGWVHCLMFTQLEFRHVYYVAFACSVRCVVLSDFCSEMSIVSRNVLHRACRGRLILVTSSSTVYKHFVVIVLSLGESCDFGH